MSEVPFFDLTWFKLLLGMIIGLALGSFATMLSYRLPRHLSIVTPPSHCPNCGHTLSAKDLVPMVSYVVAKGRCNYCYTKIGVRYPLIELATGILSAFAFALFGYNFWLVIAVMAIVWGVTFVTMRLGK